MTDEPKEPKTGQIVPFGKYKGQPVEVLAHDRQYLDWLAAQPWFRERYQDVYNTVIVNNFREPSETPEHNALQALFLDDDFCLRFQGVVKPSWGEHCRATIESTVDKSRNFITSCWSAMSALLTSRSGPEELLARLPENPFKMRTIVLPDRFERGCDVLLELRTIVADAHAVKAWDELSGHHWYLEALTLGFTARVEVKPTVGDDYPAVLRQMRASRSDVLFLGEYTGVGVTEAQFVRFFTSSDITVVFRRDVPDP